MRRTGSGLAVTVAAMLAAGVASAYEFARELAVAPGGTLRIALDRGSVDVLTHDSDAVRVDALARGVGASSVHFELAPEGDNVVLTGATDAWLAFLETGPTVRVSVWVPRLYGVDVRTSGGDVKV